MSYSNLHLEKFEIPANAESLAKKNEEWSVKITDGIYLFIWDTTKGPNHYTQQVNDTVKAYKYVITMNSDSDKLTATVTDMLPLLAALGVLQGNNNALAEYAQAKNLPEQIAANGTIKEKLFYSIQKHLRNIVPKASRLMPQKNKWKTLLSILVAHWLPTVITFTPTALLP